MSREEDIRKLVDQGLDAALSRTAPGIVQELMPFLNAAVTSLRERGKKTNWTTITEAAYSAYAKAQAQEAASQGRVYDAAALPRMAPHTIRKWWFHFRDPAFQPQKRAQATPTNQGKDNVAIVANVGTNAAQRAQAPAPAAPAVVAQAPKPQPKAQVAKVVAVQPVAAPKPIAGLAEDIEQIRDVDENPGEVLIMNSPLLQRAEIKAVAEVETAFAEQETSANEAGTETATGDQPPKRVPRINKDLMGGL